MYRIILLVIKIGHWIHSWFLDLDVGIVNRSNTVWKLKHVEESFGYLEELILGRRELNEGSEELVRRTGGTGRSGR
jgi:hypothetical protein